MKKCIMLMTMLIILASIGCSQRTSKVDKMISIDKNLVYPCISEFDQLAFIDDGQLYFSVNDSETKQNGIFCMSLDGSTTYSLLNGDCSHIFKCGNNILYLEKSILKSIDIDSKKVNIITRGCSDYIVNQGSIYFRKQIEERYLESISNLQLKGVHALYKINTDGQIERLCDGAVDAYWSYNGDVYYISLRIAEPDEVFQVSLFKHNENSPLLINEATISRPVKFALSVDRRMVYYVAEDGFIIGVDLETGKICREYTTNLAQEVFYNVEESNLYVVKVQEMLEYEYAWIVAELDNEMSLMCFPGIDLNASITDQGTTEIKFLYDMQFVLAFDEFGSRRIIKIPLE